jgi:hypothetical protein
MPTEYTDFVFVLLSKEKLVPIEILKTLFESWVVIPVCLLLPLILCIPEVGILGMPDTVPGTTLFHFSTMADFNTVFFVGIAWLAVGAIYFLIRDNKHGLPEGWQPIAKENTKIRNAIYYAGKDKEFFPLIQAKKSAAAIKLVQETCKVEKASAERFVEYMVAINTGY